jgi:tricorn protease
MLSGVIDHRLILNISDRPDKTGQEIALKPISSGDLGSLAYNDWVETRRRMVDSLSGGRLAYIHIQAMSGKALEKFKEELVSIAESKDGLVIDVRNNGGGNIAVHLLGILVKTPYLLRNFRDFPVTSENKMRSDALEKPMTLLINNYSASNSEIFAEGFRKLKLGKIIGEPTAGAVIGTGSYTLIDGTRIRRPSWGAYTTEMEDTDLQPRYPDILVENLPDDFINGRDPQLVRAVAELMKEL